MKTLHIIRKADDRFAREVISHESTDGGVSVLLIQDGVLSGLQVCGDIFASVSDIEARSLSTTYKLVDYNSICRMIIDHDRVVVW